MPHRAHEAIAIARFAGEPARENFVRRALAVHVGRHEGARALFVCAIDEREKAIFVELLAEVHIAAPAPSAKRCTCQIHRAGAYQKMAVFQCCSLVACEWKNISAASPFF